jgi:16S rRNA (guanine(527)-N(7))-methyltransferase RsmG
VNVEKYTELLIKWNEKFNLTAAGSREAIRERHFEDSWALLPYIPPGSRVIDIGSGAGFPGAALKIAEETLDVTLLDSLLKRVNFLRAAEREIALPLNPVHARAEDAAHEPDFRERYDFAVSRAVAALPLLACWCLGFVRVGGRFIAMKGADCAGEAREAEEACALMGGKITEIRPYVNSGASRSLIFIDKISETPENFPRKLVKKLKFEKKRQPF